MHDYIKERTIKIGKYIVETRKTVRVIAKEFGVSKSTVHKDLTERLPEINPELANEVKEILDYHKSIRHLRGGEATKMKYQKEEKEGEAVNRTAFTNFIKISIALVLFREIFSKNRRLALYFSKQSQKNSKFDNFQQNLLIKVWKL